MIDLSSSDFGTYRDLIIPEPDSPLTIDWGTAIAKNVARITKAYSTGGTTPIGSMGTYEINLSSCNFFDIAFSKVYSNPGGGWTDKQFVGTGNNLVTASDAQQTCWLIDRMSTGSLRLIIATNIFTSQSTPWVLIEYGK